MSNTAFGFCCVFGFVWAMSNSLLTALVAACIASGGIFLANRVGVKHPLAIHRVRIAVLIVLVLLAILAVVKLFF